MIRIAAVDLDGTLLPTTSVSRALAEFTGDANELEYLEREYANGRIGNNVIATRTAQTLKDLSLSECEALLDTLPTLLDIAEGVQFFRDRGVSCVIATVTWSFAAAFFARKFGFEDFSGTNATIQEGIFTGEINQHCDELKKLEFVKNFCYSKGFDEHHCIALGDGRSDVPLFKWSAASIAINSSSPELINISSAQYQGDSFLEAIFSWWSSTAGGE